MIKIDEISSYTFTRHRARLQHFADVIKEHADDDSKRLLLKCLHIRLDNGGLSDAPWRAGFSLSPFSSDSDSDSDCDEEVITVGERHMFALEVLASIQGVPDLSVSGVSR